MRIFDKDGNELQESELDLSLGYLTKGTVIKEGAAPIDDVTKFAWDDDDYEEVQYYHLFSEDPLYNAVPSQLDIIEAQVTYTAMMTGTLLEV
jgi:hypothetical protein